MSKLLAPAIPAWPDVTRFDVVERLLGGDGGPLNRAPLELLERTEYLKKQIDGAVSGALTIMQANRLKTPRQLAMSGDGTWSVSFDGSGDRIGEMVLSKTGVAAGTYPVVTVDGKGRVTAARALSPSDLPDSVTLTGAPTVPTAEAGARDGRIANTEFVRGELAALLASAPATLDTLNELATALGNDPHFATTITKALSEKASQAGVDTPFHVGRAENENDAVPLAQLQETLQHSSVPTGVILISASPTAAGGFLLCDGAALSRTAYAALFAAIGTAYGAGDGATTFNLPDGRGVVLRGLDGGRGLDAGRTLGSYQADALASHSTPVAIVDPGHYHIDGFGNSNPGTWGNSSAGNPVNMATTGNNSSHPNTSPNTTGISAVANYTGATETRMKNLSINYFIKY